MEAQNLIFCNNIILLYAHCFSSKNIYTASSPSFQISNIYYTSHTSSNSPPNPNSRSSSLQLHTMPPLNLLPQHLINQPLLLQHIQAPKPLTHNINPIHASTPTGYILDLSFPIISPLLPPIPFPSRSRSQSP